MGQDRNAANKGDQLKHSLLAEVLRRCADWTGTTYSETHAGAGIYNAEKQEEGRTHIRDLRDSTISIAQDARSLAGGHYARLLRDWWSEHGNRNLYPGSVIQAAKQLKHPFQMRVTEAGEDTHQRLSVAMRPFGIEPRLGGFQENIRWLTENDPLVMLIDPFTYTADPQAVTKGRIDLGTLTSVIADCWSKSACIIGFWCAMGQKQPEGKNHKIRFTDALRDLAAKHSATFRWFEYGQYSIVWIGIAAGRAVVDNIPGRDEWNRSWLNRIVKESD